MKPTKIKTRTSFERKAKPILMEIYACNYALTQIAENARDREDKVDPVAVISHMNSVNLRLSELLGVDITVHLE